MNSEAPQCDAREEETLLATNDTAAASISVDGGCWQQSTVLAGMKWLDRAMSARFSTIRPLEGHDLDGSPLDSLIHDACKIRGAETKLLELFAAGELNGTVHTCVGQELFPIVLARYLRADDYVVSNHRGHGHYLSVTGDFEGLIAEVMGRTSGPSGGYGGSQHLRKARFYSNGIQGGMTPIAVGLAQALKEEGTRNLCVCFIGDGTLGEGVVYEAFNLAAKWQVPVLFAIEDNGYAQSSSKRQTLAGTVAGRAGAFGIRYFEANIVDVPGLDEACGAAIHYIRGELRPAIIHVHTMRLNSHSKGDDNRDCGEIQALRKRDIVNCYREAGLIDDNQASDIEQELVATVGRARSSAPLLDVKRNCPVHNTAVAFGSVVSRSERRVVEQTNEALRRLLARHSDLLFLGEDIEDGNEFTPGPYGGAFKVSRGLSHEYPGRVRNTPISEAGFTGLAVGRALAGKKTIVEIMFGDFCTLIIDQVVQHADKFPTMYGTDVALPLMIRTPMGGRRGYGPTHSQSIERLFTGMQNLVVLAVNHHLDIPALYSAALNGPPKPTFMIENKVLYTIANTAMCPKGYAIEQSDERFPTIRIQPTRHPPSFTIFTYGHSLALAEAALVELMHDYEVFGDIICPSALTPINLSPLIDSVSNTKRLLTVEEGSTFGALGAELISQLLEHGVAVRSIRRLGNGTILPCSAKAEARLLPSSQDIVQCILEMTSK
jgi:2-oxoisovalerate dehydrogenase E1 component